MFCQLKVKQRNHVTSGQIKQRNLKLKSYYNKRNKVNPNLEYAIVILKKAHYKCSLCNVKNYIVFDRLYWSAWVEVWYQVDRVQLNNNNQHVKMWARLALWRLGLPIKIGYNKHDVASKEAFHVVLCQDVFASFAMLPNNMWVITVFIDVRP